jgi:hypothetical protein
MDKFYVAEAHLARNFRCPFDKRLARFYSDELLIRITLRHPAQEMSVAGTDIQHAFCGLRAVVFEAFCFFGP